MAWKKDLEKLKQSLGAEDTAPPRPAPPPRPQAKPAGNRPIEEEDDLFLSAMGQRAQPRKAIAPDPVQPAPHAPPAPPAPPPGAEFASAMGGLKGMVPIRPAAVSSPAAKVPAPAPAPPAPPEPPPEPEPAGPPAPVAIVLPAAAASAPAPSQAVQIHLAAGMAIEVDGVLDLKGHSRFDAEERLKERIIDGRALGWRTLHVLLGPSEELRQMVLDLLGSPAAAGIARYAQAPIPMGGGQAWILYFRIPAPESN